MHELDTPRDALLVTPSVRVQLTYLKWEAIHAQQRTLDAAATWWAGEYGYVRGHDLMRGEDRTFRTDRIFGWQIADAPCWLVRAKTIYSDLKQIVALERARTRQTRSNVYTPRPRSYDAAIDYAASTIDELAAMTLIVVYVAGVDGRVAKTEQREVDHALRVWARGLGIDPDSLTGERVEIGAYHEALQALSSAPVEARTATLAAAFVVAAVSGGLRPEELRAVVEIESAFALGPA